MAIGYICKKCGGPSPVGVGYATNVEATTTTTTTTTPVTACPCGYSQEPTPCPAAENGRACCYREGHDLAVFAHRFPLSIDS